MLWALIAVALAGVVAGTRFRAGALAILSVLAFAGALTAALLGDWSILGAIGGAFGLMIIMQFFYLLGAAYAYGQRQKRERRRQTEQDASVSEPTS